MFKVSVIMNCYNGAKYLREAIDSVYAQTFKDWEIIFWDNCSTDESPDIARSYDRRLKYFRGTEFLSLGRARNRAVEQATGEYIAFLDCDDLWLPNKLELQMPLFNKNTIVVYSNYIIRDMLINLVYIRYNPEKDFHSGNITRYLCKGNFIGCQTAVVRKDILKRLDTVFDTELMFATDYDLFLRLSFLGEFNYTPEPLVIYRKHKINFTNSRRHIIAHDFSYLIEKYKNLLDKNSLNGIAKLYASCLKKDLRIAGFRILPAILNISFSLKKILQSIAFLLFTDEQLYRLKDRLEAYGMLNFLLKLFYGIYPFNKNK